MAWLEIMGKAKFRPKPTVPEPIRPQSCCVKKRYLIYLDGITENVLVNNFSSWTHSDSLVPSSRQALAIFLRTDYVDKKMDGIRMKGTRQRAPSHGHSER
jgi:hypothetical protein